MNPCYRPSRLIVSSGSIDVDGAGDFELVEDGSDSVSTRKVSTRNAGGD